MKKIPFFLVLFTFFILPWHALLVTVFQCKFGWDVSLLRFWKEIMVSVILFISIVPLFIQKTLWNTLKKDTLIIVYICMYIVLCAAYIYVPHFNPEIPSYLGFRYDVFFLLAFLAGYFISLPNNQIKLVLKSIFISTNIIVVSFLLWYLFFDI
jgi:hypothetical protein